MGLGMGSLRVVRTPGSGRYARKHSSREWSRHTFGRRWRGPTIGPWGKRGMSPYSVHSCIKLAQIPIDQFGYPIRVVDCPTYPDHRYDKCYRYVYKDPALVPDEADAKVGRRCSSHFGSRQNNPASFG